MTGKERALRMRRKLKEARESLGLTQQDVADRTAALAKIDRLTKQSVAFWEKDQRQPRVDLLSAWARAVGLVLIVRVIDPKSELVTAAVRPELVGLAEVLNDLAPEDIPIVETFVRRLLAGS